MLDSVALQSTEKSQIKECNRKPIAQAMGFQIFMHKYVYSVSKDYASTGAPTGQTPAQAPQSMQAASSIT